MTANSENTSDELQSAKVDLLSDGEGHLITVPRDLDVSDLGALVLDRLEANGRATLPDDEPDENGERVPVGTVYWEGSVPSRLERADGDVVHFTEDGGVDRVEEPAEGGRHE